MSLHMYNPFIFRELNGLVRRESSTVTGPLNCFAILGRLKSQPRRCPVVRGWRRMGCSGIVTLWCVCLMSGSDAGVLLPGTPRVEDTQYVIPVVLSGSADGVAALDFRVQYDPQVFEPVTISTGAAAAAAQKQVTGNTPSPGDYIVVMMGLNQTTVSQGEIARLVFRQVGEAEEGVSRLTVLDTTLATWDGTELPSEGGTRVVRTDQPADNADEPDMPDAEPGKPELPTAGDSADGAAGQTPGRRTVRRAPVVARERRARVEASRASGEAAEMPGGARHGGGAGTAELSAAESAAQAHEELISVLPVPGNAGQETDGPGAGQQLGHEAETVVGAGLAESGSAQTVEQDARDKDARGGSGGAAADADSRGLLIVACVGGILVALGLAVFVRSKWFP